MNQKKRAIALMMLVRRRTRSCSSRIAGDQFRRRVRALAEADQRLGERAVGVHRHVAGDVVEDVRLGQVVELVGRPDGDGGREFAVAQAVEEQECRNVAADRLRLESGQRLQKPVDVLEARDAVRVEAQRVDALAGNARSRSAPSAACIRAYSRRQASWFSSEYSSYGWWM